METIEAAAVRRFKERLGTDNDGAYFIGFKDGYDYTLSQSDLVSKWIPCSERLPDIEEDVWIWFNDRPYRAHLMTQSDIDFHGFKSGIYWDDTELFKPITGVIYWQPYFLPQPPQI